jgi:hypothetical protein
MKNTLIVFPDWEERSVEGVTKDIMSVAFSRVIILQFENGLHEEATYRNIHSIRQTAETNNLQFNIVTLNNHDAITLWFQMENFATEQLSQLEDVHLDISTMPREIIWMILHNVKKIANHIFFFYHKPAEYGKGWLTKDADTPRFLLKHSGVFELGKPTALIIVTGFDAERVVQLINFYDADEVYLIMQSGEQYDNAIRNNFTFYDEQQHIKSIFIDAYNDRGFNDIGALIGELHSTHNIIIASLGPKLTALSLYQLYLNYPDIALAYVPCRNYNINYSSGTGACITGKINFEDKVS